MKEIDKSNELIARFMGGTRGNELESTADLWFFSDPDKPTKYLRYHSSWDCLMIVVILCETIATEKINELANGPVGIDDPKSWRAWDYRRVRLSSNIDETYKQVVTFIEWCNNSKSNG